MTQDTGTPLARNSSIFSMMAASLTSRPSESHVHQPNPDRASGIGRRSAVAMPSRFAAASTHARMASYGSAATAR